MSSCRHILVVAAIVLLGQTAAAERILFEDDFRNGVVADSDAETGFWSSGTGGGNEDAISESSGILSMTQGDSDGANASAYDATYLYSATSSDFNFFARPLEFKVRGITFDDHGTGIGDSAQRIRLWIGPDGTSSYNANDAIVVRVSNDGAMYLGKKQDTPSNTDGTQVAVITGLGSGGTYGFDFMIAQIDAHTLQYRLEAYANAMPVSVGVVAGKIDIDASAWGSGSSDSRIGIHAQEGNVTGGTQYFSATVAELTALRAYLWEENLLSNAGFELGNTTDWTTFGAVTLSMETTTVQELTYACEVSGRSHYTSTLARDIDPIMGTGSAYRVSIWARLVSGGTASARLRTRIDDGSTAWLTLDTEDLVSTAWTKLQGTTTYTYDGTLNSAIFYIPDPDAGTDLLFDNASVTLMGPFEWVTATTTSIMDTTAVASAAVSRDLTDCVLVWDTSDKGMSSTNDWTYRLSLGSQVPGTVSGLVTGLSATSEYTWRLYGDDGSSTAWSAATPFTSAFPNVSGSLTSIDYIVGESDGPALDYYASSNDGRIGMGGAGGNKTDRNVVLGLGLPDLPTGTVFTNATLHFEITKARDAAGLSPALHVYLLNTSDPDSSGTTFFYQGASNSTASAKFVGEKYIDIPYGVTAEQSYDDDRYDISFELTGAAAALLSSFYGGDHIADQAEAFFRFNLDVDPSLSEYIRYYVDTGAAESWLAVEHTVPRGSETVFYFR